MPIVKRNSNVNDFAPAPEGTYQAVVCDLVDLGYLEKTFQGASQGLKPHVQVVYQLVGVDEDGSAIEREDGKPWLVFGRRCVLSMNERAAFYKECCGILGKKYVESALDDETFDVEVLVGRNVQLSIVQNEAANGQMYANIENMMPWNKQFGANVKPRDYERRHERDNYEAPEFSSFEDGPKERMTKDGAVTRAAPVTPRAEPDPRSQNPNARGQSQQYAKDVAAGREPQGMKMPQKPAQKPVAVLPDGDDAMDDADPFEDA